MPAKQSDNLTDKQERFCQEYMVDNNGLQSAIRAGYSKHSAQEQSSALLSLPKVKERISYLKNQLSEFTNITAAMVLQEFARIGFSDISEFVGEDFTIKELKSLPKKMTAAIESIEVTTKFVKGEDGKPKKENKVKFRLHSKVAALENISKHIGFFEKDNTQKKPTLPAWMTESDDEPQTKAKS